LFVWWKFAWAQVIFLLKFFFVLKIDSPLFSFFLFTTLIFLFHNRCFIDRLIERITGELIKQFEESKKQKQNKNVFVKTDWLLLLKEPTDRPTENYAENVSEQRRRSNKRHLQPLKVSPSFPPPIYFRLLVGTKFTFSGTKRTFHKSHIVGAA
jgi:hypothetical protein